MQFEFYENESTFEVGFEIGCSRDTLALRLQDTLTEYSHDSLTTLPRRAFFECTNLGTVRFESLQAVMTAAFYGCSGLVSVDLPVATHLFDEAFRGCRSLGRVDFLKVEYIMANCFAFCRGLTALVLRRPDKVCKLDNVNAFDVTPIANGTGFIYVPDELVEAYKTAANWSTYAAQIKPLSELSE